MSAARPQAGAGTKQRDIFAAADRLAAAGAKPTLKALRRELGGGSYRDLSPALRAWRETHENSAASVPQAVARRAREFGAQVWILAAGLAEERLKADRSAMLREKAAGERQHGEAAELADRLTAELQQARADIKRLNDRASAAEQSAAKHQGQLGQLRRQADLDARALREARAEASAARERAARLQGQLDARAGLTAVGSSAQLLPGAGRFAGERFGQALRRLSDGAFKVFAHVCLHAPRASGELAFRQAELAHSLGKSRSALARHLTELADKGVCTIRHAPNQHRRSRLRVRTRFWPYRREASSAPPAPSATAAYIDSVRQAFLKPACVQAGFGPDDRRLAAQWHRDSIPVETVRRAIHLGCVRKSAAMIDHPQSQPIRSLRYFRGVLQEVRELSVSDSFWDYVEVSLRRLERRRPDLNS